MAMTTRRPDWRGALATSAGVVGMRPGSRTGVLNPTARVLSRRNRLPSHTQWFMDYRNSDGSVSEMCGNGIRLFARYLVDAGLADGVGADPGRHP